MISEFGTDEFAGSGLSWQTVLRTDLSHEGGMLIEVFDAHSPEPRLRERDRQNLERVDGVRAFLLALRRKRRTLVVPIVVSTSMMWLGGPIAVRAASFSPAFPIRPTLGQSMIPDGEIEDPSHWPPVSLHPTTVEFARALHRATREDPEPALPPLLIDDGYGI